MSKNKEILGKIIDEAPKVTGHERLRANYKSITTSDSTYFFRGIFAFTLLLCFLTFFLSMVMMGLDEAKETYEKIVGFILLVFIGTLEFLVLRLILKEIYEEIGVRLFGKRVTGLICEYICENNRYYKIIVNTSLGYRCITYCINDKIDGRKVKEFIELKVFNNKVLVTDDVSTYPNRIGNLLDPSKEFDGDNKENTFTPYVACKMADISFWNSFFYLFLGFGFVAPIVSIFFISLLSGESINFIDAFSMSESIWGKAFVLLPFILFTSLGILALSMGSYNIFKYTAVNRYGINITGRISGCDTTNTRYNGKRGVVYNILIKTKDGNGLIRYNMHGPSAPYKMGELVSLKVYKDYVLVGKYSNVKKLKKNK